MGWLGALATLIVKCIFLIFILFYNVGIIIYSIKVVCAMSAKKKGSWRYWYIIIGNISMILVCIHIFNHLQFTTESTDLNLPYLLFLGGVNYMFSSRYFRWKRGEDVQTNLMVEDKERM